MLPIKNIFKICRIEEKEESIKHLSVCFKLFDLAELADITIARFMVFIGNYTAINQRNTNLNRFSLYINRSCHQFYYLEANINLRTNMV